VACFEVLVAKNTYNEGEGAVVRQGHLIAVVASFLMGCAVLVVVGCAGVRSGTPREEQGHTQATTEQERSPQATTEEARCEGTRTFKSMNGFITARCSEDEPMTTWLHERLLRRS
jgi:hypothetical protein